MNTIPFKKTLTAKPIFAAVLLVIAFLVLTWAVYTYLPVHQEADLPRTSGFSIDWKVNIREASLRLISGKTPYFSEINLLPPWAYLILAPIALLPPALGAAVMFVLTYLVYILILVRLKAKPIVIIGFILCRFVLANAFLGNVDFLAALGFILPAPAGLFFVLMKPQLGIGIAIYWLVEAWRKGRIPQVARVFAPVTIAYLLSFALYGFWPARFLGMRTAAGNPSIWPYGIPVGIYLIYKAIKERKALYAMGASPFLAPYVNITSYAIALLPFIENEALFLIAIALTW